MGRIDRRSAARRTTTMITPKYYRRVTNHDHHQLLLPRPPPIAHDLQQQAAQTPSKKRRSAGNGCLAAFSALWAVPRRRARIRYEGGTSSEDNSNSSNNMSNTSAHISSRRLRRTKNYRLGSSRSSRGCGRLSRSSSTSTLYVFALTWIGELNKPLYCRTWTGISADTEHIDEDKTC